MTATAQPRVRVPLEQRLYESLRPPPVPPTLPAEYVAEFLVNEWIRSMGALETIGAQMEWQVLQSLERAPINDAMNGRGPEQRCSETLRAWQAALDRAAELSTPERLMDVRGCWRKMDACLRDAIQAYRDYLSDRLAMLFTDGVTGRMELLGGRQFRLTYEVPPELFPDAVLDHVTRDHELGPTITRTIVGFVDASVELDGEDEAFALQPAARAIAAGFPATLRLDLRAFQGTSYRRTLGAEALPIARERCGWLEFRSQVLLYWTDANSPRFSSRVAASISRLAAWAANLMAGLRALTSRGRPQHFEMPELHPLFHEREEEDQ
jgi:hypothetical protein